MTAPAVHLWPPSAPTYRRSEVSAVIGQGDAAWERASRAVLRWGVKTASGFTVDTSGPVVPGDRVTVTARVLGIPVVEPVEVVAVVDEGARVLRIAQLIARRRYLKALR